MFAREADLKRHMRTTKLHSAPALYVSFPLITSHSILTLGHSLVRVLSATQLLQGYVFYARSLGSDPNLLVLLKTDALRRHQKSRSICVSLFPIYTSLTRYRCMYRHNGVVIEPDAEKDKDGPVASGSDSQSPGPSSAPVTKEKAPETTSTSPPVATVPPGLPPPNTPSGYYRQQTVIPPPYQSTSVLVAVFAIFEWYRRWKAIQH